MALPVVSDYQVFVCDVSIDLTQNVDLSDWNSNYTAAVAANSFEFFHSFSDADTYSGLPISNWSNYPMTSAGNEVFIRITDSNGCHSIAKLNVSLLPTPVIQTNLEYPICVGKTVTIDAGIFDRYLWSTGETTPSIVLDLDGDYWVTVFENHLTANG